MFDMPKISSIKLSVIKKAVMKYCILRISTLGQHSNKNAKANSKCNFTTFHLLKVGMIFVFSRIKFARQFFKSTQFSIICVKYYKNHHQRSNGNFKANSM